VNNENTTISCDVCLDLIPIVKDNVASADSSTLVYAHIKTCESCRAQFTSTLTNFNDTVDDKKIINAIKKSFYFTGFIFIACGALIGIYLSNSNDVFYNFLIMPMVGACGYLTLKEHFTLVPVSIFVLSYIGQMIQTILDGALSSGFKVELFYHPLFFSIIYVCLTIVGIFIATLLKFAFRKEGKE
jgi:hypothetical protein